MRGRGWWWCVGGGRAGACVHARLARPSLSFSSHLPAPSSSHRAHAPGCGRGTCPGCGRPRPGAFLCGKEGVVVAVGERETAVRRDGGPSARALTSPGAERSGGRGSGREEKKKKPWSVRPPRLAAPDRHQPSPACPRGLGGRTRYSLGVVVGWPRPPRPPGRVAPILEGAGGAPHSLSRPTTRPSLSSRPRPRPRTPPTPAPDTAGRDRDPVLPLTKRVLILEGAAGGHGGGCLMGGRERGAGARLFFWLCVAAASRPRPCSFFSIVICRPAQTKRKKKTTHRNRKHTHTRKTESRLSPRPLTEEKKHTHTHKKNNTHKPHHLSVYPPFLNARSATAGDGPSTGKSAASMEKPARSGGGGGACFFVPSGEGGVRSPAPRGEARATTRRGEVATATRGGGVCSTSGGGSGGFGRGDAAAAAAHSLRGAAADRAVAAAAAGATRAGAARGDAGGDSDGNTTTPPAARLGPDARPPAPVPVTPAPLLDPRPPPPQPAGGEPGS